eukprot:TRINITY_DN11761_c0_g1_i1.p1 TRINITY_DN11761_c0_g1~~TRINITY_DN11761_c0_g1_i1.p1  ORF type:complete len:331 (-),score=64.38 TRINITY_DN11761_c0_g1_i1:198-1190(-)
MQTTPWNRVPELDALLLNEQKSQEMLGVGNFLLTDSGDNADQAEGRASDSCNSFIVDPHLQLLSALLRSDDEPETVCRKFKEMENGPEEELSVSVSDLDEFLGSPKNDALLLPSKRPLQEATGSERNTREKKGKKEKQRASESSAQKETHVHSERQRRRGMNHLFERMKSLLPNFTQKADKATIVSAFITYIQSLQDLNSKMAKTALQSPAKTESLQSDCTALSTSSASQKTEVPRKEYDFNLSLHFSGKDLFITIVTCNNNNNKKSLLSSVISFVKTHNLELQSANISMADTVTYSSIHLRSVEIPDLTVQKTLRTSLQNFIGPKVDIY